MKKRGTNNNKTIIEMMHFGVEEESLFRKRLQFHFDVRILRKKTTIFNLVKRKKIKVKK